jgi:hypothetical protein
MMATQLSIQENHTILTGMVRQWDRRLRLQQSVYWLPRVLMPGLVVGILLAVLSRTRPWLLAEEILTITIILITLGLLVGGLAIWLWRRSLIRAARRFDLLLDLDERTSTALELLEGRIHSNQELLTLQLEDARLQARAAHVRDRLPLRSHGREWGLALLLAALVALLLLLPNPQADLAAQSAEQSAAIEQAAEDLREITEEVASDSNLSDPEREQLLEVLDTSTETLQQENVTPEEAFAAISDAQAALQNQADIFNQRVTTAQGALDAAAEQLTDLPGSGQSGSEDAVEQMMQALQQVMQNMPGMSSEQNQQAAQQLSQAAQSMQNSNPQAAQNMQQAADAMQSGDQQQAQQNLQQAQENLQQQQQQQAQQQQAAQQMSQQAQQAQQAAQQVSQSAQQQQGQQQGQQSQQSQQSGQQQSQQGQQQQSGQQQGQQSQQSQQSGQQQGQGQQAQEQAGQSPGEGQQEGQEAPNAMSGAAFNPGTGSSAGDEQGGTQQGQQSQPPNQSNNPDGQGESEYEPIYAPQRIGDQPGGEDIFLEPDSSDAPVVEDNFTENPTGNTTVPYNQVFSSYRNAANQALDSGYIPLGLRDIVRDYFTSLEPGR